jgi:hypothetical protein
MINRLLSNTQDAHFRVCSLAGEAGDDRGEIVQVGLTDDIIGDSPPLPTRLKVLDHLVRLVAGEAI